MAKRNGRISYSELWDHVLCPHYHRLKHEEKLLDREGTIHTAFGTAVHDTAEKLVNEEYQARKTNTKWKLDKKTVFAYFLQRFEDAIKDEWLGEDWKNTADEKTLEDIQKFKSQGVKIIPNIIKKTKQYFGKDYVVIGTEELLKEDIDDYPEYYFKGYIDCIIHDPKKDTYHILDWKTSSWGWKAKQKTSKKKTYQLTYYKHFFCKKENIPYTKVKCHFALLKRIADKGKDIEFFEVPVGKRKIKNALELLKASMHFIDKGYAVKDRRGCKHNDRFGTCEFYNTEHCIRYNVWEKKSKFL